MINKIFRSGGSSDAAPALFTYNMSKDEPFATELYF